MIKRAEKNEENIPMKFIQIHRDEEATHIHIPHLQLYLLIIIVLILLVSVGAYVGYNYYLTHVYDSSAATAELQDFNPPSPPQDVKKQLQQLEKQKPISPSPQPTLLPSINKNTVATASAIPHIASISAAIAVPIIMYHYVEYVQDRNDKLRITLNTTPYVLENEIQILLATGYHFITNSELTDVLDGKANLPSNPILLTFDDGYRDFYTDAYPILKKYHVKATNYVIAGFLNRPNHLLTSQLQEIGSDGLVEIGSHTINHIGLRGLPLKTVGNEVFQSREMLEQLIHKPVVSFAYPFGSFDDQAIQVVKDAGYRSAVSTLPGINQSQGNRFYMFRLRPGGATGQAFLHLIHWGK